METKKNEPLTKDKVDGFCPVCMYNRKQPLHILHKCEEFHHFRMTLALYVEEALDGLKHCVVFGIEGFDKCEVCGRDTDTLVRKLIRGSIPPMCEGKFMCLWCWIDKWFPAFKDGKQDGEEGKDV